jgi:hypothetical protein
MSCNHSVPTVLYRQKHTFLVFSGASRRGSKLAPPGGKLPSVDVSRRLEAFQPWGTSSRRAHFRLHEQRHFHNLDCCQIVNNWAENRWAD